MTTTTAPDATVLDHRLTAADRCDSCGAQAYIAFGAEMVKRIKTM